MKRMKFLFGQRRMQVLLTLAVLLLAVSVVIGSGASFTSTSANPGNVFTAGNLHHTSNPADGTAILTASLMVPGQSKGGTATITNTGDVPGEFYLSKAVSGELKSFGDELNLTIADGGTFSWTGKVNAAWAGGRLDLGQINPGVSNAKIYTFKVAFPDTGEGAENGYQGGAVTAAFTWTAISIP